MNIAVIGGGGVGETLARAWARGGHAVEFGVRDPASEKSRKLAGSSQIAVKSNRDASAAAQVIVLATPWRATREAITACGDLSGKIVIDCTNPLNATFTGLDVGLTTSGAEQVASWAPGARVFKAMNQIGSNLMDHPKLPAGQPVMFVAGPPDGKAEVLSLVRELGFDSIDAGDLEIARLLEPYAMLWIHLALRRGLGRDIAFALLRDRR
jgi:8-hydroxy-5-deazaflavin:NADPH oxidoreductase